ncbi:hypothetical protein BDN72DRAFT_833973 [Pluteus cervinus]|uniref:Uncharacterized protein n=1 Tax=Pluteus cervinus TaxID=181527 RepID=A0ACD3B819_9AGAR|nr:hypothetical protein BDN72DRAFT_833973 [Pluteus cervinus]
MEAHILFTLHARPISPPMSRLAFWKISSRYNGFSRRIPFIPGKPLPVADPFPAALIALATYNYLVAEVGSASANILVATWLCPCSLSRGISRHTRTSCPSRRTSPPVTLDRFE